jgi:polysaccharide pyruvyl transferase WcaK-like protein
MVKDAFPNYIYRMLSACDSSIAGVYIKIFLVVFYRQPSVYLLGGGQLLRDNSTFPHAMLAWAIVSRLRNVPLILYSVGLDVGARERWLHRAALKLLCKTATVLSVRDEYSRDYLQTMGFPNSKVVPDVVFLNPPGSWQGDHSRGQGIVVFVSEFVVDKNGSRGGFTSLERYFGCLWERVIADLLPGEKVTVSCSSHGDVADARRFGEWLAAENASSAPVSYVSLASVDEFLRLIRGARRIVSTRMHPIIVAKLFGVEYSAVPFNKKTEDMARGLKETSLERLIDDSRQAILGDIEAVRRRKS